MAGNTIFHLVDGKLHPMAEEAYDSEDVLQALLASHPDLIAGDQLGTDAPVSLLLVAREKGIPGVEGGLTRWSVDHLFLDQDAVPTLVEVKRSTDTRIRREVVGQMLDYAANANAYWPPSEMRAAFEHTCSTLGEDPDQRLASFLGEESSVDDFWASAAANARAGRLRLLFVADEIPAELQRIIEFLNEQMPRLDVLGVEVRQFLGDAGTTLVPRVIGRTQAALQGKASTASALDLARRDFFAKVFVAAITPGVAARKPSAQSWTGFGSGPFGSYVLRFTKDRTLNVEIWLDGGTPEQNAQRFTDIKNAGKADATITGTVEWEPLVGKITSRFGVRRPAPDLDDPIAVAEAVQWAAARIDEVLSLDTWLRELVKSS